GEHDIPLRWLHVSGGYLAAGRSPGRPAAVEHAHVGEPGAAQRPPGARRRQHPMIVVDHHRHARTDAPAPGGCGERRVVGQRMPSLTRRPVSGQLAFHVDEDRTGNVSGEVLLAAVFATELPARVEHLHLIEPLSQLRGGDQRVRGVHSGIHVHGTMCPAVRNSSYHSERDSSTSAPAAASVTRCGVVVPGTTCMCAGWRVIHAVAIAIGVTSCLAASRSSTAFSSAYFSLPRKTPSKKPPWNGDQAWMVMSLIRQYSTMPPPSRTML